MSATKLVRKRDEVSAEIETAEAGLKEMNTRAKAARAAIAAAEAMREITHDAAVRQV